MTKLWHISLSFILALLVFASPTVLAQTAAAPQSSAPGTSLSQPGTIQGTIADVNDDPVAGASVALQGPAPSDVHTVTTNDSGFFEIGDVQPEVPYHVTISAGGFAPWESPVIILNPGQHQTLDVNKLRVEEVQTSVNVTPESSDEIAIQQVKVEEQQRGLAIIPNFFEAYGVNPAPLTPRLKFSLSLRLVRDPFTAVGVGVLAGVGQAEGISPNYARDVSGFGERFGADYANQFTDIMIGGAILPSLLHQDPRYFYQGTGSKKSRAFHAIASLVIAKGDNGRWQPNYSSFGGDLASAAISNAYYPASNRGVGLVFQNFAINSAVHLGVRLLQEFAFRPTKGTTAR